MKTFTILFPLFLIITMPQHRISETWNSDCWNLINYFVEGKVY